MGKLRISDPTLRPASWMIWNFDHNADGSAFLFEPDMLGVGDVIALMEDVNALLRP
jgi:hypothetical protein